MLFFKTLDEAIYIANDTPYGLSGEVVSNHLPSIQRVKTELETGPVNVNPDVVIALGGGTALDMAKVIAVCGVQEGRLQDYITGARTPESPGPPIIAVPVTSGTGSEATHFAVIYIGGRKYSLAHPFLHPEYVFIERLSNNPREIDARGLYTLLRSIL